MATEAINAPPNGAPESSTHMGVTTLHPKGSAMPVCQVPLRLTCMSLILLTCLASEALAACTARERYARLPALGCSPAAIEAICAGQRAMPSIPDCGGTERAPVPMGDRCETWTGGCLLPALAPLASTCECHTMGGTVYGWVVQQGRPRPYR